MFGSVKLKSVLSEYRRKHEPHTKIDIEKLDYAIGLLTAMAMPSVKDGERTPQQKELDRAAVAVKRCRRLLAVIEQHERLS
jgi:hypothetical protein